MEKQIFDKARYNVMNTPYGKEDLLNLMIEILEEKRGSEARIFNASKDGEHYWKALCIALGQQMLKDIKEENG